MGSLGSSAFSFTRLLHVTLWVYDGNSRWVTGNSHHNEVTARESKERFELLDPCSSKEEGKFQK